MVCSFLNLRFSYLKINLLQSSNFEQFSHLKNCIFYSKNVLPAGFSQIEPEGLLNETHIRTNKPHFFFIEKYWYSFKSRTSFEDIPFDIFAFSFYYLSRYEEYQTLKRDDFQRFRWEYSLEKDYKCSPIPILDYWWKLFFSHFFNYQSIKPKYSILPTFDIDKTWAYTENSVVANIKWASYFIWKRNLIGIKNIYKSIFYNNDPYDINRIFINQFKIPDNSIFFVLLANRSNYDKNIHHSNPKQIAFFRKLSQSFLVGIHPSFFTAFDEANLAKELDRYQAIFNQKSAISRQHYLRFDLPKTYRLLIKQGIKEDYSMGYPDNIGFRLGTSSPTYWFDLENNIPTTLKITPFSVMDVTLKNYLNLDAETASKEIESLKYHIQSYGGTFCFLWHNSSFDESAGWDKGWLRLFKKIFK